jgi:saccharopine dehydrogenase-like NADP-dependent oxidoreductase
MLNAKSHHPEQIKRAAIGNTIKTYTSICSTDALFEEAERTFERRDETAIATTMSKKSRQQNENCQDRKSNLFPHSQFHSFPEALPRTCAKNGPEFKPQCQNS